MLKLIARSEQRKYAGFDPKVDASAELVIHSKLTKERTKGKGTGHGGVACPRRAVETVREFRAKICLGCHG
jgi:hypothetical protein